MLPQPLLLASLHLEGERIVPHYFSARDEPWLRALIAEYAGFVGKKHSELHEHLRGPQATRAPKLKLRIARLLLDGLCRARPRAAVPPKQARAALFRAAAPGHGPRLALWEAVAASFSVSVSELESALFADLQSERTVAELPGDLSPAKLVSEANLALVGSLLRRAARVRIVVHGDSQSLIRHARLSGLICCESPEPHEEDAVSLDISGPFELFRHGEVYARALAALLPRLARCTRFELSATCALTRRGPCSTLLLSSADAIQVPELAPYESRLIRLFERDFRRIAAEWTVLREPAILRVGECFCRADFELVPPGDPARSWLLEIVGFSTPEYVRKKLDQLLAIGVERFVLCVDRGRLCADGELPRDPRVLCHRARIDAARVFALVTSNRAAERSGR